MKSGLYNTACLSKECPEGFLKQCEGSTAVLFPPAQKKHRAVSSAAVNDGDDSSDQAVFYNPAQVVNRDLSICAIEAFSRKRLSEAPRKGGTRKGITILEALSATGLRAIRYFKEISNIKYIIANDLDADAVDCIVRNALFNDVPLAEPTAHSNFPPERIVYDDDAAAEKSEKSLIVSGGAIIPNRDDAVELMHRLATTARPGERLCYVASGPESGVATPRYLLQSEAMDVVDLDPYGSASPFLEGAFRCIKEGGLMLVTSTDSAILCGNYPDTCHAKYNSVPYKGAHCHEMAVRILLACMERVANKHGKYIVPLVSFHIDFYVRCFVRVYEQPAETKLSACKLGYQLQCTHCPAFWVRPLASFRERCTKRERRALARAGQGVKRPRSEDQTEGVEGTAAAADGKHVYERFPGPANRQDDPKVSAIQLASFPPLVSGGEKDGGGEGVASTTPLMCPVCGSSVSLSGPLYAAPTQCPEFLQELLGIIEEKEREGKITAVARVRGLVQVALEELPHCPLFYEVPDLASYVRTRCPPTPLFVSALSQLGYTCSQVHCSASGIKTDSPPEVLFGVMLAWKAKEEEKDKEKGQPEGADSIEGAENKKQSNIRAPVRLLIDAHPNADFTYRKECDFRQRATGLVKFVPNAPGWGPKRRHQGAMKTSPAELQEK